MVSSEISLKRNLMTIYLAGIWVEIQRFRGRMYYITIRVRNKWFWQ